MAKFWIAGAIKKPGSLRAQAKKEGSLKDGISKGWLAKAAQRKGKVGKRARLAQTLAKFPKRGKA